jgi:vacuolar-type H+-ATPase subunit H
MEPRHLPEVGDPLPEEAHAGILERIDARERDIERTLNEARETAAAMVREARRRAAAIVDARREEAEKATVLLGAKIVAEARRSAEEILADGAAAAAAVRGMPRERMAHSAEEILAVILPAEAAGGDAT